MWNLFNIHRIRYKLTIMILLLSLTVLTLAIFTTYRSSTDIIRQQSVELNNKLLQMGKENLETSVDEVDKIYRSLYISKEFNEFNAASGIEDNYDFINTYTSIKNLLHSVINTRRDIFSIIYVNKRGFMIYTSKKEAGYERNFSLADMPQWFQTTMQELEKNRRRIVLPTHPHIPINFKVTDGAQSVYTIGRSIINVDNDYAILGSMYINLDLSAFREMASQIKPYHDALTYIVSADGTIVYDSTEKQIGQSVEKSVMAALDNGDTGEKEVMMNDRRWMVVYTTSDSLGWKIMNFIPVSEYSANISVITKIALIVCAFAVLFSILIAFLVSRHISNPIEHLTQVMRKIDLGSMSIRAQVNSQDEIGVLAGSFNDLISKLQIAIANEYEAEFRQREAEMRALQSQINPHFLNNVLQSIGSIALIHNVDEISVMAKSLGRMLRYNIRTNVNMVSVNEEAEHVSSYLSIQKIRFADMLDFEVNIPQHFKDYPMLKFTLQPIVENAIHHGFENKTDRGIINITCEQKAGYLVFDISDNGKGIPHDQIAQLYNGESDGIGLMNVLTRLKLMYNDQASLTIESEEQVGTSVIIRIPIALMKWGDQVD